jgi:ATP-dependent protease ClpP protease subunit
MRIVTAAVLFLVGCTPAVASRSVRHSADSSTTEPSGFIASLEPSTEAPGWLINIGTVGDADLAPVLKKFDERVAAGDKEIFFRINSFGGSVFDGMDFIMHVEDAKRTSGVHVKCVSDVKSMSMGFAFLQSFCDERLMTKRSILLAHNSSSEARGTVEQIENQLRLSHAINESLATVCAARLKIPLADYKAKIAHGDWPMNWEEAIQVGAVDGTVDPAGLPPVYKLVATEDPISRLLGR